MKRKSPTPLALLALLAAPAAAQLTAPIVLPGDLVGGASAGVERLADMARGGGVYLAVWEDNRAELTGEVWTNGYGVSKSDILAMRLDADGQPLDPEPLLVGQLPFAQTEPKVAWNGSAWLVVWQSRRPTQFSTTEGIRAARVAADGTLLDPVPLVIDDTDDVDEMDAVVAGDGGQWAVLWRDLNNAGTKWAIASALVDSTGFVHSKKNLYVEDGFFIPWRVNLAHAGGTYMMVSEHVLTGGQGGVTGQRFDANLNKVGAEFIIGDGGGDPYVAASDTEFLVIWNDALSMRCSPVTATGTVVVPGGTSLWNYGQVPDAWPSGCWTGTDWLVTYEEWLGGNGWALHGVDVDPAGAVTSSYVVKTHGGSIGDSVSAGGAGTPGKAVVAWTDDRDVWADLYARSVTTGGALGNEGPASSGPPAQTHPDVAGDDSAGYLVTFLSRVDDQHRVMGQRLDPAGQPVDAEPFEIAAAGGASIYNPRVAWDGQRWLVVWEDRLPNGYTKARVQGRRIDPTGTPIDPAPIDVLVGNWPDVAALDGKFLVVCSEEPTDHVRFVRSQVVDGASGTLLGSQHTPGTLSYSRFPRVEVLGARWLVVWQRNATHDSPVSEIVGAFVDSSGTPAGTFSVENFAGNTHGPAVAAVGDLGMVIFDGAGDARARRIQADGTLLGDPSGYVISGAPNDQFALALGSDGAGFVAAWTDHRIHPVLEAGLGDVYAARLGTDGSVVDPAGLAVANDFYRPEGNASVAGAGGRAVVAYADMLDEYGTYRVVVRTIGDVPVGTNYCGPAALNSTGLPGVMAGFGSEAAAANNLHLVASQLPANQFGYFLASETQGFVPFAGGSQGHLCLGGTIGRFAKQAGSTGAAGELAIQVDLTAIPTTPPHAVVAGETWNFQCWFRDKNPNATSNFTDGLEVLFQ